MQKKFSQINVNLTKDDLVLLDYMQQSDGIENRSAWIRQHIRQEWARRYSRPNPAVSVAEAITAHEQTQG